MAKKRSRESPGVDGNDPTSSGLSIPSPKKLKKPPASPSEKRLRVFRPKAPQNFYTVYERALGQRFYVLRRQRTGTQECPEELLDLAGSTGNVYQVHVARQPRCTCPHAKAGNQCKHILYVLSQVLRAPFELVYQLALLSNELRTIFAAAPPIVAPEEVERQTRKTVEGDCPICFLELEDDKDSSKVVWCRAACGQNFHSECFRMWARTQKQGGGAEVTCPLCRTRWQEHDGRDLLGVTTAGGALVDEEDGYANVAAQLGISRVRDTSTYHAPPFSTWRAGGWGGRGWSRGSRRRC